MNIMYKLMCTIGIIGLAISLVGLGTTLTGCSGTSYEDASDKDNSWIQHGNEVTTKVVEIEDHKYIIMDGFYSGGIIHAESCKCKKVNLNKRK